MQAGWARQFVSGSTLDAIFAAVSFAFDVTVEDLMAKDRHQSLILPRHIAMWLARRLTGASYPELARQFGQRDHTTIVHAVQKVSRLYAHDERLRALITELLLELDPPRNGTVCRPGPTVAKCTRGVELRRVG